MTIHGAVPLTTEIGQDPRPAPKNVHEAAQQFEALLIGQLFKNMREAGESGWLGTGEDHAGSTMMEVAEQHLAQTLATNGGLGLANLVEQGLNRKP
jgi:flagellar protein FlgJ